MLCQSSCQDLSSALPEHAEIAWGLCPFLEVHMAFSPGQCRPQLLSCPGLQGATSVNTSATPCQYRSWGRSVHRTISSACPRTTYPSNPAHLLIRPKPITNPSPAHLTHPFTTRFDLIKPTKQSDTQDMSGRKRSVPCELSQAPWQRRALLRLAPTWGSQTFPAAMGDLEQSHALIRNIGGLILLLLSWAESTPPTRTKPHSKEHLCGKLTSTPGLDRAMVPHPMASF